MRMLKTPPDLEIQRPRKVQSEKVVKTEPAIPYKSIYRDKKSSKTLKTETTNVREFLKFSDFTLRENSDNLYSQSRLFPSPRENGFFKDIEQNLALETNLNQKRKKYFLDIQDQLSHRQQLLKELEKQDILTRRKSSQQERKSEVASRVKKSRRKATKGYKIYQEQMKKKKVKIEENYKSTISNELSRLKQSQCLKQPKESFRSNYASYILDRKIPKNEILEKNEALINFSKQLSCKTLYPAKSFVKMLDSCMTNEERRQFVDLRKKKRSDRNFGSFQQQHLEGGGGGQVSSPERGGNGKWTYQMKHALRREMGKL